MTAQPVKLVPGADTKRSREMKRTMGYLGAALVVVGSSVAIAAQPAARQRGQGRDGLRPDRARAAMEEFLGLTEDQKATLTSQREEARKTLQPLMAEQRRLHQELRTALEAEGADATAVGNLMLSLHKQRQELRSLRKGFEDQRLAVLTPEQQTKLEAFKAARKMGPGKGRRGPGGPGMRGFRPQGPEGMDPGFGPEPPPEPEG
jgi:Spy/CpxP family protein refolding chaperone